MKLKLSDIKIESFVTYSVDDKPNDPDGPNTGKTCGAGKGGTCFGGQIEICNN